MGDVARHQVSSSVRENFFSVAYVLVILAGSVYFSHRYVAGLQSASVEWFSRLFIPLLTLFVHLLLLRVLSVKVYLAILFLDLIIKVGLVTYHDYFGDNLDLHVIWANFSEGAAAASHVLQVALKNFLPVGPGIVTLRNEVYASRVGEQEFVPARIVLLENGTVSKPQVSGDGSNLLTGTLDLRSLHYFAKDAYP